MRTITIELSVESCNKALKELEEYRKKLKSALDEICKRVAEFGLTRAEMYFEQAPYDGIKDFHLEVKKISGGYSRACIRTQEHDNHSRQPGEYADVQVKQGNESGDKANCRGGIQ